MKNFPKLMVLSILMIIGMMWTKSWAQTTTITITASPGQTETHYICEQQYNQVVLYKPSWALTGVEFFSNDGYGDFFQDSIIITNANDGSWVLMSSEGNVGIYIYLISAPPTEPFAMTSLSTCGSMHSQMGAQPGTTYLWNTGATTESIQTTVVHPSYPVTYAVTVTNACGLVTDNFQLNWAGPLPNLGPDDSVCNQTTLNPGTFMSYQWTGGSTQPTLNVTNTGTYAVTVTNSGSCKTTDQVAITINSAVSMEMCYVSFDTATWKNQISWYVDPGQNNINSVQVEVWQGTWVSLGLPSYTAGSFIDWTSNPQGTQYTYQVRASNACGLGAASTLNVTIWLTELSNELQWQNYLGVTAPTEYTVFAIMDTGTIIPVDTVFACLTGGCLNHSPITYNPNVQKYFVAFQQSCTSNKSNGWVLSNYWDPITGTAEVPAKESLTIFPNPTSGIVNIAGTEGENQIDVLDISGRLVLHTENASSIDLGTYSPGIYNVKVSTSNGVYTSKVVKQ